jgi:NADH-quinone oxidoreductase subunit N
MVGLAFKLSAVPFHFWCPDVFEGASAEVNAFLSVASKAAALGLLVRVALGFAYVPEPRTTAEPPAQVAVLYSVADQEPAAAPAGQTGHAPPAADHASGHAPAVTAPARQLSPAEGTQALRPVRRYLVSLIAFLAAVTCTFGNLAAYGQTNIKRLLAYSTIAHAGYMMMPVAAAVALVGRADQTPTRVFGQSASIGPAEGAIAALVFYTATYLFMNLGAFAVVAFLRNAMRSEEIEDYAGLLRRCPGIVICFSIILLSLIGMPPMSGFIAKFLAFGTLVDSGLLWLLVIGGLNTAISLFYYLRIIKTMTLDPEPDRRLPVQLSLISRPGLYIAFLTVWVVVLGIWFNWLNEWSLTATHDLLS